jgi:integrase
MRKRFQKGSIQKGMHGERPVWIGLYYDTNRRRKYVTLGDREGGKNTNPPLAIRNALAAILRPINEARAKQSDGDCTVAAYVEQKYIPFAERKWKASTAITTKQRLRQHIVKGEMADLRMSELTRERMQDFLDRRGICSFSTANHLRWDLKAICDLAVSDGILPRSQARQLFTPRMAALPKQPVMTPEQVQQALEVLDLRERTFCRLAIYAGMRPGEIIALKWTDIRDGHAVVDDRYYKGEQGDPKNRKPRNVALSPAVQRDLATWKAFAVAEDALIFPSENLVTPIKYENLWQREIKPRFKKIGLAWADFRCMRRTNSTLMRAAGADPKVAADNRGHSLNVAMEVYTQSTAEQKSEAVGKLEDLIQ